MYTLALSAALTLASCGGSEPSTTNETLPAVKDSAANQADEVPIAIGKTATASGVEFTLVSVSHRDRIGASHRTAPGETFVVVRYDVKNLTNEPMARVERPEVTLRDREGRSYSDEGAAGLTLTEGGLDDAINDTNPNMTAHVTSVWKVDKASFDPASWTLLLGTDPQLRFALE